MKPRLEVLWKHYSSYLIYAIIALGSLQDYIPQVVEYVPRQVVVAIAVAALIAKLIPQNKGKDEQCK